MAFTRFHDDPARIQAQLQSQTWVGRYQIDKPGPGVDLPFMEDPQIRMQQWGANLRENTTQLESELRGLTRTLCRDNTYLNNYQTQNTTNTNVPSYRSAEPFVDESRASHPAWMFRGIETPRWEEPFCNPQVNLEKPFAENVSTRILEKDSFVPIVPYLSSNHDQFYPVGTTKMCEGGNKISPNCIQNTLHPFP